MRLWRRIIPVLLVLSLVLLSGCVYWRLLQFKNQFKSFHEHFEFKSDGDYGLLIHDPVLDVADVDWLFGAAPSWPSSPDPGDSWRAYEFEKLGNGALDVSVLSYRLRFRDQMLVEVRFPSEFRRLYPEGTLETILASLGDADVDKSSRTSKSNLTRQRFRSLLPSRDQVRRVLGEPSELDGSGEAETWVYRYQLRTPNLELPEDDIRAVGRFHFRGPVLTRIDAGYSGREFRFDISEK